MLTKNIKNGKLIDAVQIYPIIYDLRRANYKRVDLKGDAWTMIASIVGCTELVSF
jgi:hypothetical protein